jgi:hypothetical protein
MNILVFMMNTLQVIDNEKCPDLFDVVEQSGLNSLARHDSCMTAPTLTGCAVCVTTSFPVSFFHVSNMNSGPWEPVTPFLHPSCGGCAISGWRKHDHYYNNTCVVTAS